jgi:hypothetical protein
MIVDTYNNLLNIKNLLQNNNISSSDTIILFEYAGFGDTIHTRYLIQHIQEKYKNIVWITLGLIQDLYREHEELIIFSNTINNRLRNPSSPIVQAFSELMLETFNYIFNDFSNKIDISNSIIKSHVFNPNKPFANHYFNVFNVQRNNNIKHLLKHTSEININNDIKPIIAFEHCSETFSSFTDIQKYQEIVNLLKDKYDIVLFGSLKNPYIDGTIDYRGKTFYEVFSVLKKSKYFIGRNSANQQLTVFLPDLPVLEIDTDHSPIVDFKTFGYKENVYHVSKIEDVLDIIKV